MTQTLSPRDIARRIDRKKIGADLNIDSRVRIRPDTGMMAGPAPQPRTSLPAAPVTVPTKARKRLPVGAIAAALAAVAILGSAAVFFLGRSPDSPPAPSVASPAALAATEAARSASPADTGGPAANAVQPAAEPPPAEAPAPVAQTPPPAPALVTPDFRVETANEERILENAATQNLTVFRLNTNPRILILDFASLTEQAQMLNRVAALVEKAGQPRDRLLTDAELDAAVRASGSTPETYYYGHDYGSQALVRFFRLADRAKMTLNQSEMALRHLMEQEGWFDPNVRAGLISLPRNGADERITPGIRAAILHHELSHGEYFTSPDYTAFTHQFWTQNLSAGERERIRAWLGADGYDASALDVMENEMQAYLMFTDSPELFSPDRVGISPTRLASLRNSFARGMPAGWLRDVLTRSLLASRPPGRP